MMPEAKEKNISLPIDFAPMEGITEAIYRRAHHACFGGVDTYYLPFISPTMHLVLNGREKNNVLPKYNEGLRCVPQVLTKDPEHFLWAARLLADMGYEEINLNAGCPSATVTTKDKGAGILKDPDTLARFLDRICEESPVPVSVKTRAGFESPDEWERLVKVYAGVPLKRLILHPRTRNENYTPGRIHPELVQMTAEIFRGDVIYNGDLFSRADVENILKSAPGIRGVMLGRGLVANPAFGRELKGGEKLKKEELIRFHDMLSEAFQERFQKEIVFMKLRVVMKHLACCFEDAKKEEKAIRRAKDLKALLEVDRKLFETKELKEDPCFIPDELKKESAPTMII